VRFCARAERTVRALVEKCYDAEAGLFYDRVGRDGRGRLRVNTVSSLMPLVLDIPPEAARALVAQIEDPLRYKTPFPVPSTALDEPGYLRPTADSKLVWRGPTWLNTNWYLSRGLRRHGREDLARVIEDRSAALVERSGFREYYDPFSGEGFGAEGFSWSALALDMLANLEGLR
jgi:glycogen debranching enzyme